MLRRASIALCLLSCWLLWASSAVAAPTMAQVCTGAGDSPYCGTGTGHGWYMERDLYHMHYMLWGLDWLELVGSGTTLTVNSEQAALIDFTVPVSFSGGISGGSMVTEIRFCGLGPAPDGGEPPTLAYLGFVPISQGGVDYSYGSVACDNLASGEPYHPALSYKPIGMVCVGRCTTAGGADETYTFQLTQTNLQTAVAGVTCNITLTGDNVPSQCAISVTSLTTIPAGVDLDITITPPGGVTTDDCSNAGDDFECRVFVTY